jgi:O-acetyl-ADP-ribose deacetylase (regulator of RNase III)
MRMPFQIIRNDITKVKADAIVNTANPKPRIGRGTDSAIYAAAGKEQLIAAREKIGDIAPGQAVHTSAFALNAKYIIHTVGPVWVDGTHGERDTLRSCYENSLTLADSLGCESIAFPLIATGTYGFPKDEALHIALSEIQRFLLTHEMKVTIVVFDRKALELSESLVGGIEQFIDDHTARELHTKERGGNRSEMARRRKAGRDEEPSLYSNISGLSEPFAREETIVADEEPVFAPTAAIPDLSGKSLDEILGDTGDSFQQRLLKLIDKSGMDDVTVLRAICDQKRFYTECRCQRPDINDSFMDYVVLFHGKYLPVETKLSVSAESNLIGQVSKYVHNSKVFLQNDSSQWITGEYFHEGKVLIIDTENVYMYDASVSQIKKIVDLDQLKSAKDLSGVRQMITACL